MINNNYQPNFTATYVPKAAKFSLDRAADKLNKYFELKGFGNCSVEKVREQINHAQAGVLFNKDGSVFIGKDREADEFIARQLRPESIHINYFQDTPETKFEGQVIDLTNLDITI